MREILNQMWDELTEDFYSFRFFWYGITASLLLTSIMNPIFHATIFAVILSATFYLDDKYIARRGF